MIRLLIIDDSALMRRLLGEIFTEAGGFEIAIARDGEEGLAQVHAFAPDVVTLDIQMPVMDGLACLDRIMLERPCPVVMVSTLTEHGAQETLEALDLGAVDFVFKPQGAPSLEMGRIAVELVTKVRAAADARIPPTTRLADRVRMGHRALPRAARAVAVARPAVAPEDGAFDTLLAAPAGEIAAVIVGVSTGGPPALDLLLRPLPADFPWPIVIAQHMPGSFTGALARRLDRLCALAVVEVDAPMPLVPGRVFVARGDGDLVFVRRGEDVSLLPAPGAPDHAWHPSADRLVASARAHFAPERLIGVLMTGMGNDGAAGMAALHREGGRVLAQDEASAVVWGMPGALVAAEPGVARLSPAAIGAQLMAWAAR